MVHTRLPRSLPESFKFKKEEPSPLVKARVHERRAEKLRDAEKEAAREGESDPTKPHLQFLERMTALHAIVVARTDAAKREFKGKLDKDTIGPHEVLGHVIGTLPRPRLDRLFADERIGKLNALLMQPSRKIQSVLVDNERLQDLGITWGTFVAKKRDLKFQLGLQTYKSAQALAMYFVVIESAASPKVKKKANFVQDAEVLALANEILRDVATHVIEEMQLMKDRFFDVSTRKDDAIQSKGGRRA